MTLLQDSQVDCLKVLDVQAPGRGGVRVETLEQLGCALTLSGREVVLAASGGETY